MADEMARAENVIRFPERGWEGLALVRAAQAARVQAPSLFEGEVVEPAAEQGNHPALVLPVEHGGECA